MCRRAVLVRSVTMLVSLVALNDLTTVKASGAKANVSTNAGLCSQTFCKKGKMCIEGKVGTTVTAECVCPTSCTSETLPVCSVYHVQFLNLCELHRFACANEIHIQVKHQGNCTEEEAKSACTMAGIINFQDKYLQRNFRSYKADKVFSLVERLRYAKRDFDEYWDRNRNGRLDEDEILRILHESIHISKACTTGLIRSCDIDGNPGISKQEWFTCFKTEGGQWRWSRWTDCSVSCGGGKQRRTGTCILPSTGQKLERRLCDGFHHETRKCSNGDCPDRKSLATTGGQWRWSRWTDCSVSCGGGKQRRTGTCILPSTGQKLERRLCDGFHHETRKCSNGDCPDWISSATTEGKWSRWSPWTDCSRSCGKGGQRRSRVCRNKVTGKSLKNGWCAGKPQQEKTCADWKCPDRRKSRCPSNKEGTLKGRVLSLRDAPLAGANISLVESPYLILSRSQDNGYFVVDVFCFEKEKPILITRHGFVSQTVYVTNSRSVLKIKMENAVHPSVTSHPEDRRRFVGQDVTFCCQVEGNPPPVIEWFRNGNILDKEEYNNNETLVLTKVGKNMAGDFRCRAINDFGAEFSEPAALIVLDPVVDTCNSTPSEHFVTLPVGCFEDGTSNKKINVGKCNSHPCLRVDTPFLKSCDEGDRCCQAGTVSETTVHCGHGEFKMKRVVSCRCNVCRERNTVVKGIVVGGPDEKPVEYCDILVNGTLVAFSDFDGTFEIPVAKSAKRLVATFRDFLEEYEESTVVLPFRKGATTFHKIHLRLEVAPIEFDAEEEKAVPIASDETAEVIIPANSLIDKDGNPKKGKAKVKVQFNDPRNERDILESPGDFTTVDEDGEEQLLRTYGLFKIKVQDENNQNLGLTKNLHINIDLEKLTGEKFDESEPMPHLWWLDEKTGRWVDAGELKRNQELKQRPKRQLFSRAFSGEITPDNIGYVYNFDQLQQPCFAKVRANADEEGIEGAKVTSIFINRENSAPEVLQGYGSEVTNSDGYACVFTQCNSRSYLEVEKDGLPLRPNQVDSLPPETEATVVDKRRIKFDPGAQTNNGPVYQKSERESCKREIAGQSFFSFHHQKNTPEIFTQEYIAVNDDGFRLRSSRFRRCFVKILTSGTTTTLVKAESFSENGQTKLGETLKQTEQIDNLYAACLEYSCPRESITFIHFTVLTGECQRSKVQKRLDAGKDTGLAPNVERVSIPTSDVISGSAFGLFEWLSVARQSLESFENNCIQTPIEENAGGELKGFAVKFNCAT